LADPNKAGPGKELEAVQQRFVWNMPPTINTFFFFFSSSSSSHLVI